MLLKYALAWIPMMFIGVANGAVRELVYAGFMSELAAHRVSSAIAILLFAGYAWLLGGIWPLESAGRAVQAGLTWLVLTVAFEFVFGRFVAGHSWAELLADYNVLAGRVWVFVPAALAVLPYLVFRLRSGG